MREGDTYADVSPCAPQRSRKPRGSTLGGTQDCIEMRLGGLVGGRDFLARILAYVTGMVDQELLARNEY